MKNIFIIITCLICFASHKALSQTFILNYAENQKIKLSTNGTAESELSALVDMETLKKALLKNHNYKLIYHDSIAYYQYESENTENTTGIKVSQVKLLHKMKADYSNDSVVMEMELLKKKILIEDNLQKWYWSFTGKDTILNNYLCHEATSEYMGQPIIAYYTSEIPINIGPRDYYGLPGLIVFVDYNNRIIKLKNISKVKDFNPDYSFDTTLDRMTKEEFESLYEKKKYERMSKK